MKKKSPSGKGMVYRKIIGGDIIVYINERQSVSCQVE